MTVEDEEPPPNQTLSADPASRVPAERTAVRDVSPVRDPGRYEILGEHGRGGLGRVSRAHDKDFGRDIAIKELLSRGHVNELRFVREAMITARLEHPGIVPVYEAGRWPDGTPFYAMKLVSGRSLRAMIAERKTVDERIGLLHHVIAVADTIAYAHGRNIIHRDLKPANVIVGDFGETVVIDWGLAKDLTESSDLPRGGGAAQSPDDGLTSAGSVLGTPTYMPPEQERGESVDQRADVFAIGAMLWELCALQKVPPVDLSQRHRMLRRAGIDADLVTIIDKSLDPDPARRYADAGALAADLKAFKSGARIAARDYTLWAMLAHWTRRHRALALSITAAVVLAATSAVVFVRNIAIERDRADMALVSAQRERDRAKLSEASLVIDKEPNRAGDLLASFAIRSPRVALLMSRAQQLSAYRIIPTKTRALWLSRARGGDTLEIKMPDGELTRMNLDTAALTVLDRNVTRILAYRDGQPLYVRRVPGERVSRIATPTDGSALDVRALDDATELAAVSGKTYVLDASGGLHRVDQSSSVLVARGVFRIAGDGDLLMVCRDNGELEITRRDVIVLRRRCAHPKSPISMAVVGAEYAALTAEGVLLLHRGGRPLEIPTSVRGEYELALSSTGAIAIASYLGGGQSWFVRPGGTRLEPGPVHAAQPYSVAADGNLIAWGYEDGDVIVRDTVTGGIWELRGHAWPINYVVLDAQRSRVVTADRRELRVWDIPPDRSTRIAEMPCSIFHVEPSPDYMQAALDCNDGTVRLWSRRTGAITPVHTHIGYAQGLQWMGEKICSGGRGDGSVRCSFPDGSAEQVLKFRGIWIRSLTASPDRRSLIFAEINGTVWQFDGVLRALYTHTGLAFQIAISASGRLLASCAEGGEVIVFDLVAGRVIANLQAHAGTPCGVRWEGEVLWSSGAEGTLKRWLVRDGELTLRHMTQAAAGLSLVKVFGGSWAAIEGTSVLLVSRDGASIALRIDTGRNITALDVSSDGRHVAASMNGEIVVIDLERNAIATLATGSPVQQLSFLEPGLIAFSEPAALKTLRVEALTYVAFEATPEPPNRASF